MPRAKPTGLAKETFPFAGQAGSDAPKASWDEWADSGRMHDPSPKTAARLQSDSDLQKIHI